MTARSYADIAETYARDVVGGDILACKWTRLACQRHLDDLERESSDAWPFRFDADAGARVCRFLELLPHVKGAWAGRGETLRLEPWQVFLTCCIFGWLRKADGLRRFRRAFILVPRKNGKSFLTAGWGLWMFAADGEHGAEVFSGATTEKQALEVFRPARLIAEQTEEFRDEYGVLVNASNLHIPATGGRFEPLIGKPGEGASPSCAIHDEFHEHATDQQVDAMATGMGARDQPLQILISTAGDNLAGPCYQAQLDAQKVLEGVIENDELFTVMYGIDDDDDWTTDEALRKANPNFGISVSGDFLRQRQREALDTARRQGVFKTKHLNAWVAARNAYFNMASWAANADPALSLDEFEGQDCHLGLDLASKVDIAALEILLPHDDGFTRFGKYYLPEATVEKPENEHYRGWATEGLITVTDGAIIDFEVIEADILELCNRFDVAAVGYDPHQATMLVTRLLAENVPMLEYRPLTRNFSEPMKQLDALSDAGKISHNGDPVMAWMMSNTTAKVDAMDNVYPRKEKPENKIDGVVALIMALGTSMADAEPEVGPSVYETEGFFM